jgi:hypothetical protein
MCIHTHETLHKHKQTDRHTDTQINKQANGNKQRQQTITDKVRKYANKQTNNSHAHGPGKKKQKSSLLPEDTVEAKNKCSGRSGH